MLSRNLTLAAEVQAHLLRLRCHRAHDQQLRLGRHDFDLGSGVTDHGRDAIRHDENRDRQQPFLMASKKRFHIPLYIVFVFDQAAACSRNSTRFASNH